MYELLGLGDVTFASKDAVTNQIARLASTGKAAAVADTLKSAVHSANMRNAKGKRAIFLANMHQLPEKIKQGLLDKKYRMTDAKQLYFTKAAGSSTSVNMIKSDDQKAVGKTNVASAKLDTDKPFLVTAIQVLSGAAASGETEPYNVTFGVPEVAILNGEFEFAVNSIPIVENSPCTVFDTTNSNDSLRGYFNLDNPVYIDAEKELKFNFNLTQAAATRTWIRVILHGVAIVPAGA